MSAFQTLPRTELGVTLRLGPWVDVLPDSGQLRSRLEAAVAAKLDRVTRTLGLAAKCVVRVELWSGPGVVRVELAGRVLRYPERLALQLQQAVLGTEETDPRVLGHTLTDSLTHPDSGAARIAISFLVELALEALKQHPERLMCGVDIERLGEALRAWGWTRCASESASLEQVLSRVLAMGVRWEHGDGTPPAASAADPAVASQAGEDVADALIACWRPHHVEVCVEREYLEALLDEDVEEPILLASISPRGADLFSLMSDGLFYELGVRVPPILLVPDESLPPRSCRVQLTHLAGPLVPLLPLDRVLVNAEAGSQDLEKAAIPARLARNPANGQIASTVPEDRSRAVQDLGYTVWTPFEYLILALSSQIRRGAALLVDRETVGYELSQLDQAFPDLVRAALTSLSLTHLTETVRGLLQEGVSIRNLRTILERLLKFSALRAPIRDRVLFDDRLLLDERRGPAAANSAEARLEFVRIGLRHAIQSQCARGGFLYFHLLTPEIEERLTQHVALHESGAGQLLQAAQLDALCDAVCEEFAVDQSTVAMITTASLRLTVRELLRDALPQVAVLAWEELSPEWNVQLVSRVAAPKGWTADDEAIRDNASV